MKHLQLVLLVLAAAVGVTTQTTQATPDHDSCRTVAEWDAASSTVVLGCAGGCESSNVEWVIMGTTYWHGETASCSDITGTNAGGTYSSCGCTGAGGSGESPCCHLVVYGDDNFNVVGDCVSCGLGGVCQLYDSGNGVGLQAYCGPPPPPSDDDDETEFAQVQLLWGHDGSVGNGIQVRFFGEEPRGHPLGLVTSDASGLCHFPRAWFAGREFVPQLPWTTA